MYDMYSLVKLVVLRHRVALVSLTTRRFPFFFPYVHTSFASFVTFIFLISKTKYRGTDVDDGNKHTWDFTLTLLRSFAELVNSDPFCTIVISVGIPI